MDQARRILGIDPGLQRCGWGVVEACGGRLTFVACGVVSPPRAASLGARLCALLEGLEAAIAAHGPGEAAAEETYVNGNPRSALALGQARGAALLAAARAGLAIGEYAPATIKKAVTGSGAADKQQVMAMVRRLLPLAGGLSADSADALAAAICHAAHGGFNRRAGA